MESAGEGHSIFRGKAMEEKELLNRAGGEGDMIPNSYVPFPGGFRIPVFSAVAVLRWPIESDVFSWERKMCSDVYNASLYIIMNFRCSWIYLGERRKRSGLIAALQTGNRYRLPNEKKRISEGCFSDFRRLREDAETEMCLHRRRWRMDFFFASAINRYCHDVYEGLVWSGRS